MAVSKNSLWHIINHILNSSITVFSSEKPMLFWEWQRGLKSISTVPQYLPYFHKTIILGTAMLFSCSSSSPISLPFFVTTNIFLISPQRKGEIQLLQYHGDHPNYHFSAIFSLTLLWNPPFIWVLGKIYCGTATASPPINLKSDIRLPQYRLIGGVVLEDSWRCSYSQWNSS